MDDKIEIANAAECLYASRYPSHVPTLWLFQVGACGPTTVAVWDPSLESALEELGAYLVDSGKLGLIMTHDSEELRDLYNEAREELGADASEEEVAEAAETNLTYTESGYIPSDEWWVDEIESGSPQYREILIASLEELGDSGDGSIDAGAVARLLTALWK